jgi:hypothetical protein
MDMDMDTKSTVCRVHGRVVPVVRLHQFRL